jgi:hypothetical protein
MRTLVSEIWPVHEECVPAWISALNSLGVTPDVLLNAKSVRKKGSILSFHPSLRVGQVFLWRPTEMRQTVQRINATRYDLIVANSFEGQAVNFYRRLRANLVGITHNYPAAPAEHWAHIQKRWHDNDCLIFPTVLWSFIETNLRKDVSFLPPNAYQTMYPVTRSSDSLAHHAAQYFGKIPFAADQSIVSIPGGVNYQNRDYLSLFNYLQDCNNGNLDVMVDLPGGGEPDRLERFVDDIKRLAIEHRFPRISAAQWSAKQGTPYADYYSCVFHAHSLLGLFKPQSRYRTHSISSTVPAAINLQRPVFLNDEDASLYGLPNFGATTSADAIAAAFNYGSSKQPLDNISAAMRHYADALHSRNIETLSRIFTLIAN